MIGYQLAETLYGIHKKVRDSWWLCCVVIEHPDNIIYTKGWRLETLIFGLKRGTAFAFDSNGGTIYVC